MSSAFFFFFFLFGAPVSIDSLLQPSQQAVAPVLYEKQYFLSIRWSHSKLLSFPTALSGRMFARQGFGGVSLTEMLRKRTRGKLTNREKNVRVILAIPSGTDLVTCHGCCDVSFWF